MAQELRELELEEVSLVDRPACSEKGIPRARIALTKRHAEVVKAGTKGVKFVIGFPKEGGGGSEVQSVIFDQNDWTEDEARQWLKDHDFSSGKMDKTEGSLRFRQADPDKFGRFRTISPGQVKKEGDHSMTLEQIEKKVEEQDKVLKGIQDENTVLKTENELVLKMNSEERRLYAVMPAERRLEYINGDVAKRKKLLEDQEKEEKEKALVGGLDDTRKAEYAAAGPARRAQILKEAEEALEKKKTAKAMCPDCDGTGEVDGEDCPTCDGTGEVDSSEMDKHKKEPKKTEKRDDDPRIVELQKRAAEAEDNVAKVTAKLSEIEKRERLENFTKRAEEELPNTPGSPAEKGEMLMKMADAFGGVHSAEYKRYFGTLKEADKIYASQYTEIGKMGGPIPAAKVWDAKVEEIAKRDKLGIGKATAVAMKEAPELYVEYERAQRQLVRSI